MLYISTYTATIILPISNINFVLTYCQYTELYTIIIYNVRFSLGIQ